MKLLDKIKNGASNALKERNRVRLSVLRTLLAEIKNREIAKRPKKLEEIDIKRVIANEIREREEGIRIYKGVNAIDRVKLLETEVDVLREFLPLLDVNSIKKLVNEAISATGASTRRDMGKVLSFVMPKIIGQADPEEVKAVIMDKLSTSRT